MGHVLNFWSGSKSSKTSLYYTLDFQYQNLHILVNQVCGSGLRSVVSGFQSIKLEEEKLLISGGQENMS